MKDAIKNISNKYILPSILGIEDEGIIWDERKIIEDDMSHQSRYGSLVWKRCPPKILSRPWADPKGRNIVMMRNIERGTKIYSFHHKRPPHRKKNSKGTIKRRIFENNGKKFLPIFFPWL